MALAVLAAPISAAGTSVFDVVVAVSFLSLALIVLLRAGVIAHVAMWFVVDLLTWLPLTLDADAWYFGRSLIVLLLIGGLVTYGFVAALGGRPAFGTLEAR